MMDGILDIELVPRWSPSSVKWQLVAALARAQRLQAGIGYWTVADALLGPDLVRALHADDGFVCVDLHLPTDVDALAALAAQGAHVRVYHEDIRTYAACGRREPPQLMHTKMLLFWVADRTAELWVGSHNWTHRALLGLNVEASLVVRMRDTSPLCRGAAGYLAQIKRISEAFDPAKVDFYKEVQGRRPRLCPVIELDADDAAGFAGTTVAIFGTDTRDLAPLDTIQRHVCVALIDRASGTPFVYAATILHSRLLAASDAAAGGLSFSPRPFAFRRGQQSAALGRQAPIDAHVLDAARYFVTLRLGALQPDVRTEAAPERQTEIWVDPDGSPLLARLDEDAMRRLFRGKEPCVRKAVARGAHVDRLASGARRESGEQPLVAMRVLRRAGQHG